MLLSPATIGAIQQDPIRRIFKQSSLDLRFAENKSLVDATTGTNLVDFTRASSGTYVGSDGLIKTATTNLLLRSEEFDNATWTASAGVAVTPNVIESPFGTLTADLIEFGAPDRVLQQNITGTSGVSYTGSIWVKGTAGETIRLGGANITGAANKTLTGGWDRLSFTGISSSTSLSLVLSTFAGATARNVYFWGAQLEQSSTVGEYVKTTSTINSAPRFDHDPTTGESLGLLVEEQRTNSIRNNTMVGAVAGTPGTLPTNWSEALAGLTRQVVGTGIENGISYIDIRLSGTSTGTQAVLRWEGGVTASDGQSWAHSVWLARKAGTLPSSNVVLSANLFNASSVYLADTNGIQIKSAIGSSLSRVSGVNTISTANTATARPYIYFLMANGEAVDFTLRIGMPQFELGAFATSVIPTTGSTVTRAADVASNGGASFSSWYKQAEGTFFAEVDSAMGAGAANTRILQAGDGTSANRQDLAFSSGTLLAFVNTANSTQVNAVTTNSAQANTNTRLAYAYKQDDFAWTLDAGAIKDDLSGTPPTVDRLGIGQRLDTTGFLNGHIKRLAYWSQRLSNSTLQQITQ